MADAEEVRKKDCVRQRPSPASCIIPTMPLFPTASSSQKMKMAALKRAYADILLNMAKESAARIVASDRRALRFQQDLFRAKEEALSTLLRVKGIMDSKVDETERVSLSQVRRIQELEIQLTEAEKTIKDLKIELKRVNDELRGMKSNQTDSFDKQSTTEGQFIFHGCMCQKAWSQRTANGKCYFSFENASQVEPLEDFTKTNLVNDPVLTSIIMRSKEPELYRNGCTQRIRAFEQSILTRKVSHGQTDDQLPKNKCFSCENKVTEEPNSELPEADIVLTRTKETNGSKDTGQLGGSCEGGQVFFQGFSLQRKRSRIKRMMSSLHNASNQVETGHEPSESPSCNNLGANRIIEHDGTILQTKGEVPKEMDANLVPVSSGSSRDLEGGSHLGSGIIENKRSLLNCKNPVHVESDVNDTSSKTDSQTYQSATTNMDNINCCKPDITSDVLSEGSVRKSGDSMLAPEGESRINQSKSENLDTSISTVEPENIDGHLMNPESIDGKIVESSGPPPHGTGDRLLKYTFRRKRKRGSSTSVDENVLRNSNTSDGGPVDKQTVLIEPQEPALLTGSSRGSRRIAQVARQLISLSEKRW